MKYESSIFNGMKVIAKVKVFVRTFNKDMDAKARATCMYDISSLDIPPGSLKQSNQSLSISNISGMTKVFFLQHAHRQHQNKMAPNSIPQPLKLSYLFIFDIKFHIFF